MNVFLAIYEEHKQRTRHDIYAQRALSTLEITCSVCLHLGAEKRQLEKEEREYYEKLEQEQKNEKIINDVDPLGQG